MEENQDGFVFEDDVQSTVEQNQETGSIFDNYDDNNNDDNHNDDNHDDNNDEPGDYVDQLLKSKGIDRNNIEITEEDGTVSTVNFDDLSDEDKVNLLSDESVYKTSTNPITDQDIELLNYFRANRINSLQEFVDGIAQQAVADYIANTQNIPDSDIDGYSDDEIIAYDLIKKFGSDMSDEEIDAEINRLKEDEDAFNKKVDLLRTYYKNEEEAQRQLYENDMAAQRQADVENFQNAYVNAISNIDTIQGIDLEDQDKQDLLDFVLTKDQFGQTEFAKALNDPEAVLRMAWFLNNGENAAEATRNYFASLLSQQRAQSASKQTRVVSRTNSTSNKNNKTNNSFKF